MKIAVIGAGIGGMTAAAALVRHDIDVHVYEQAAALGEVGAGLQMAPNAMKVLRALGLEQAARGLFFEPSESVSLEWDTGALRHRERLRGDAAEQYGAPYLMGHRADLHAMLCSVVPGERIHLGRHCVDVEQTERGAVLIFADGAKAEADIVIAADGIHSAMRRRLFGDRPARFSNQICWRAIVPIERTPHDVGPDGAVQLDGTEYFRWIGPAGHVICYPIRGGTLLNIFAGYVSTEWADDNWAVRSSREEMLAAYAGWDAAMLGMFEAIDECFKWGIHDRDPLDTWRSRRVMLIGDAAHPMMPTLAQGAAMSMEDGYAFAVALAGQPGDLDAALAAFEAERRPRAERVQMQARAQFERNRLSPAPPPIETGWIYSYDATSANPEIGP